MKNIQVLFKHYLKKRHLRQSITREKILTEIFIIKGHFDIKFLMRQLKKYDFISRATVFRTLQLLLEAGIVCKTTNIHGLVHYENTFGKKHHDHLICLNCGQELEISSTKLEKAQEELCFKHGFLQLNNNLQIWGCCSKCR